MLCKTRTRKGRFPESEYAQAAIVLIEFSLVFLQCVLI
jgi:hypothetical protein